MFPPSNNKGITNKCKKETLGEEEEQLRSRRKSGSEQNKVSRC